ncbi:MAG: DUF4340 domain-containing protein, partial [Pirellulaceae bacterium]|nr:DUF4340 domain-containing protein [Pirellulaceae bacterium]
MTEGMKTLVYVGVACVAALAAWFSQPRRADLRPPDRVGQMLFADFQDPGDAAGLEIVRFNEELGELKEFKIARDNAGRWTIPSHGGYPADAETQMKDTANALIDLEVLGVASQLPAEHKLFGVVEPNKDDLSASAEGVGTLITVRDAKGGNLAQVIIGGAVRDAEGQRFVRVPNQDPVYVVKIDPDKFSTKFEDWIEKDLLKLNAFDVQNVRLLDYSVVRTTQGFAYDPRLEVAATDSNGNWRLDELNTYQRGAPVPAQPREGEVLNKQALDDLKTAVDDLKIVDVRRKPSGLTADLKAGDDFMQDRDAIESLFSLGFFPLRIGDGEAEIRAANGEVHVGMKDGVEYILRFGNIEGTGGDIEASNLNRYLFVTARLDESKIAKPALQELPPLEPAAPAPPDQPAPADTPAPGDKPAPADVPAPS